MAMQFHKTLFLTLILALNLSAADRLADWGFLRTSVSPVRAALGGAGVTLMDNSSLVWDQPAVLGGIERTQLGFGRQFLPAEFEATQDVLWSGFDLGSGWALGVGGRLFNSSDLKTYDDDSFYTGDHGLGAWMTQASIAKGSENWKFGVLAAYGRYEIDNSVSQAFLTNIGAQWKFLPDWTVGATVRNLGTGENFSDRALELPLEAQAGLRWQTDLKDYLQWQVLGDFIWMNDLDPEVAAGMIFWFNRMWAVQLGTNSYDWLDEASAGMRLKVDFLDIQYSYGGSGIVGGRHYFAINLNL